MQQEIGGGVEPTMIALGDDAGVSGTCPKCWDEAALKSRYGEIRSTSVIGPCCNVWRQRART